MVLNTSLTINAVLLPQHYNTCYLMRRTDAG